MAGCKREQEAENICAADDISMREERGHSLVAGQQRGRFLYRKEALHVFPTVVFSTFFMLSGQLGDSIRFPSG